MWFKKLIFLKIPKGNVTLFITLYTRKNRNKELFVKSNQHVIYCYPQATKKNPRVDFLFRYTIYYKYDEYMRKNICVFCFSIEIMLHNYAITQFASHL